MSSSRKQVRSIADEALDEIGDPSSQGSAASRHNDQRRDDRRNRKRTDDVKAEMESKVMDSLQEKLAKTKQGAEEETFTLDAAPLRNQPFWFVPKLCRMIEKRQALRKTMEERVARINAAAAEK